MCVYVFVYLHFTLGGILGARDVELVQVDMVAVDFVDDEHL